jgi:maleylacetoacetate isomerase
MSPDADLVLFDYWRSSAAYRVRIALHLKGLPFEQRFVNLAPGDDQQHSPAYRQVNPQGLVPSLQCAGRTITQSMAICEFLEEAFPALPLLPAEPGQRARVRALAGVVACDVHPVNNLRVQQYLRGRLGVETSGVLEWMSHWMAAGFAAIEQLLSGSDETGAYCHGDLPGLADCFLVPQVYNAERFDCDLAPYPLVREITQNCRVHPAFVAALPEHQPDAPAA